MTTLIHRSALCALLIGATLAADTHAQWSTDSLSVSRNAAAAVASDGKAYFAGGRIGSNQSDVVDILDEASGTWSQATLSVPRSDIAAVAVGQYVLFAGGATSNTTSSEVVDVLDTQTMLWSTTTLSSARITAATCVGNKALFAGGYGGGMAAPVASDVVDIFDADLGAPGDAQAWSTATLSVPRGLLSATSAGDHALFAGGRDDVLTGGLHEYDTVDIYDDFTGLWSTATLSQARKYVAAVSVGAHAYFAGGGFASNVSDVVDVYDADTATWTSMTLSVPRERTAAAAVGNTVLFAGGFLPGGVTTAAVDVLDDTTQTWGPTESLSAGTGGLATTSVGSRACFAAGFGSSGVTDVVDVYTSPWEELGGGTTGAGGQPTLAGFGSFVAGTPVSLTLTDAPPAAPMLAWVSLGATPFPALGGTAHALPYALELLLSADGEGGAGLGTTWPVGIPTGTPLWFQFIVLDATAPPGLTLSNGLLATVP